MWHSTNIWRREGLSPNGQGRPLLSDSDLLPWIQKASDSQPVSLVDIDALKQTAPKVWDILSKRQVRRIFGTGILKDQKTLGFLNVENPRQNLERGPQLTALSGLRADRLTKSDTEKRLNELLSCRYEDILQNTCLGLWVIRIDRDKDRYELFADRIMRQILAIPEDAGPEEC